MTSLRIPLPHRHSIEELASLPSDQFSELIASLQPEGLEISRSSIVAAIRDQLALEEPEVVLDALIGARSYGRRQELSTALTAMDVSSSETLDLAEAERAQLAERLEALFNIQAVDLLARAVSLVTEDEHAYCESRSLTDLRPLFTNDDDPSPEAAIIRHSLKITVHVDGKLESVTISADERSLAELAAAIERALKKGLALRKLAHSSGLKTVNLETTH